MYVVLIAAAALILGTSTRPAERVQIQELSRIPIERLRDMAADADHDAQFELGVRLVYGTGVAADAEAGAQWIQRAADSKNTEAQVVLAMLYAKGRGVPHDDALAAYWMRQAATLGHVNAQGNLGVMYEHGNGIPEDLVDAYNWEFLAASRATIERDRLHWTEVRDILKGRLTPEQREQAERRAREWLASFAQRRQR